SIVLTALILNGLFSLLGIVPESRRVVSEITQFKIDYTFWMNLVFVWIAAGLVWLHKKYLQTHQMKMMDMESGGKIKKAAVYLFIAILLGGLATFLITVL
ncbi:MAG: hypothetical protein ACNS64_08435, partial [Candidatus Halalkalibacterium sp. M3_1C_030]